MKLATYFRCRGDDVRFFKGDLLDLKADILFEEFWKGTCNAAHSEYADFMRQYIRTGKLALLKMISDLGLEEKIRSAREKYLSCNYPKFDIVAVTTLFTFYWQETIETIIAAKEFITKNGKLYIGGIASSILPSKLFEDIGILSYHKLLDEKNIREIIGVTEFEHNKIETHLLIGLLDKRGIIDKGSKDIIDELPLDYSILDEIDYAYPVGDAYFGYMTRGCIRRCSFCAVPKLEPKYRPYISIKEQIEYTKHRFGEQKDLLLLDNNVFASKHFNQIIDEIKDCGFGKNATYKPANMYEIAINNIRDRYNTKTYLRKIINLYDSITSEMSEVEQGKFYNEREVRGLLYPVTATVEEVLAFDEIAASLYNKYIYSQRSANRGRSRYVDFNQGVDARLLTDVKMKKLAEINIRPLRIAFDSWKEIPLGSKKPMKEIYAEAVKLAADYDIRQLSNYLLYNTDNDTPDDLYHRLKLNIKLCEDLDISIYSFPMKYHPIDDPQYFDNRNFIGKSWNRKYIRAIQAVLNSTKGKIGRGRSFFNAAFGKSLKQFREILLMPEAFIIERYKYDKNAYNAYLENGGTKKINKDDIARYGCMTDKWRKKIDSLNPEQLKIAKRIITTNKFSDCICNVPDSDVREVLKYYKIKRSDKNQNGQ
jgi:hypothetical protein